MTKSKHHPAADEDAAAQRVAVIEEQFRATSALLQVLMAQLGTPDSRTPKTILTKLNELQSLHTTIIHAQEVFYEKFRKADPEAGINYDEIRRDLGGQLDRIRAAIKAKGISEDG